MIKLAYDNETQTCDFVRTEGRNLETDDGLESYVTACLFTNARAKESDDVDPDQDQGGWWGEDYLDPPGPLGSRLWLLLRKSLTSETLLLANGYVEESLQNLIDSGVAKTVEAKFERMPQSPNAALLTLKIQRPRKGAPRFERTWEVQFGN